MARQTKVCTCCNLNASFEASLGLCPVKLHTVICLSFLVMICVSNTQYVYLSSEVKYSLFCSIFPSSQQTRKRPEKTSTYEERKLANTGQPVNRLRGGENNAKIYIYISARFARRWQTRGEITAPTLRGEISPQICHRLALQSVFFFFFCFISPTAEFVHKLTPVADLDCECHHRGLWYIR